MKRIVVVDDRPWKMQESIRELQSQGLNFFKTIYYPSCYLNHSDDEWIEEYKRVTGMDVIRVNDMMEFINMMDDLYTNPDIVFFMDYDLKGNMSRDDFFSRINVKYALSEDKEQRRIWFYTTGPKDIKEILEKTFLGRVIYVQFLSPRMPFWNKDQVFKAVHLNRMQHMTEREIKAYKWLRDVKDNARVDLYNLSDVADTLTEALDELEQYRQIGTIEECRNVMENLDDCEC